MSLRALRPFLLVLMLALMAAAFTSGCGSDAGLSPPAVETIQGETVTSTATVGQQAPLYTFAVCGDNRAEGIENGVLPRIIESARAKGVDFVVNTGDISGDGSLEELTLYRDLTHASGLRFHSVPGNHDVGRGGVSADFESVIGPLYYSFDFGGDHFILVDNADDRTGIDEAQMQWLAADIAANAGRPRQFIFAHIPVADPSLPSGHVTGERGGEGLRSGQALVEEAVRYPNVNSFFFGHIHAYFSYMLDGRKAYVTGGAGAPLYFPENSGGYYHYLLVKVSPDKVEVEVVRV